MAFTYRNMFRVPYVALIVCVLAVGGCASRQVQPDQPAQPVVWRLSESQAATYYYLVYLESLDSQMYGDAALALDKVLELEPTPNVYAEAAGLAMSMRKYEVSREYLKKALELTPDDRLLHMRLADVYLAEGRGEDSIVTLQSFLQTRPGDSTALMRLAEVYLSKGDYPEALDTLAGIDKDKTNGQSLYLEGVANARLGHRRKAISKLQQALDIDPGSVATWAELAYQYELDKDYVSAEKTYQRMLDLGEEGDDVWLRLVSINLRLNNPDRALALVDEGPNSPRFVMEAARTFLNEGFPVEAGVLLRPLEEMPDTPEELYFYLALYAAQGENNATKALGYLDEVSDEHPFYAQSLSFKGQLEYSLGNNDEAWKIAAQGEERFPGVKDFIELKAWVADAEGRPEEARDHLNRALERWPDDTGLLYDLGGIEYRLGNRSRSIEVMESIIRLEPDHADALNFAGYSIAEQGGDYDRALVLVKAALEQKPGSGHIVDSLAWVHFKRGELKQAWDTIVQAVGLTSDQPEIWEHYGDIAAALGKKKEARRGYEKALQLSPENPERIKKKLEGL